MQKQLIANTNPDDSGPIKLGMSNFIGMIFMWLIGIVISICGFICELIYKR